MTTSILENGYDGEQGVDNKGGVIISTDYDNNNYNHDDNINEDTTIQRLFTFCDSDTCDDIKVDDIIIEDDSNNKIVDYSK